MPNDVMKRWEERAAEAHAASVERGEHDDQCEYQAIKGWYLCNCSMRARIKRGLTTPPELEHQYPICLGCNKEVDHDGDGWNCPRCSTSWNSRNEGHFYDEFGDLHTEIAETREQESITAGGPIPVPNGCRWCGIEKHGHDQRHAPFVKWHGWTEPTSKQRLTRMKARRAAAHVHTEDCLCVMVSMDVEGASECHYCGVHGAYGKPCGDRCDVARAEVTARG